MRDYAQFRPRFWTRGTGKSLRGDPEAQAMASYIMTSPHSNMIGMFYLPLAYIANDLGWPLSQVEPALQRVCATGFARYSAEDEYIWVVNLARENVGEDLKRADNRIAGVRNELANHRKAPFYADFVDHYRDAFGLDAADSRKRRASPFEGASKPLQAPRESGTGTGTGTGSNAGVHGSPYPVAAEPADREQPAELAPTDPDDLTDITDPDEPPPRRHPTEIVRNRFTLRFHSATHLMPTWPPNAAHAATLIGEWATAGCHDDRGIEAKLDRLFDGFFADSWAQSKAFPIAALAANPTRYFSPAALVRDARKGVLAPAPSSAFRVLAQRPLEEIFGAGGER